MSTESTARAWLGGFASASWLLGVIALAAALVAPPEDPFCGGNEVFHAAVTFACLGVLFGCVGLWSRARWRATMGVVLSICALLFTRYIQSFGRVRFSANEPGTKAELRLMLSGQAMYRDFNGGYFDTLECLAHPSGCLPGYSESSPSFLDRSWISPVRMGYRRSFHHGEAATGAPSRSALKSFAIVAVPHVPGKTGCRGYCIDSEGILCQTDGRMPRVVGGLCDRSKGSGCIVPDSEAWSWRAKR